MKIDKETIKEILAVGEGHGYFFYYPIDDIAEYIYKSYQEKQQ